VLAERFSSYGSAKNDAKIASHPPGQGQPNFRRSILLVP
jgi:hypothetical protein